MSRQALNKHDVSFLLNEESKSKPKSRSDHPQTASERNVVSSYGSQSFGEKRQDEHTPKSRSGNYAQTQRRTEKDLGASSMRSPSRKNICELCGKRFNERGKSDT